MFSPKSFSNMSYQLIALILTYYFSDYSCLLLSLDSFVALFAFYSLRVKSFIGTNSRYEGLIGF